MGERKIAAGFGLRIAGRRHVLFYSRMFSVRILGSGSAGNCALVETPQTRLLVDGGLSARQIMLRLAQCGVNPLEIDGILLTHEHCDHAGGLNVWCKQFSTPIYCNRLTAEVLQKEAPTLRKDWRMFVTGSEFAIKDITIETFPVPHDAVEPCGFVLHHGREALGVLTDLGVATKLVQERVRAAQTLIIETNHDEKLLQNDTKRPWSVKQRIMSRHGHLSNAAAANVLAELLEGKLRRAVLGHLSRDCNSPELAVGTVRARLDAVGANSVEVICAGQREISARMMVAEVTGAVAAQTPASEGGQEVGGDGATRPEDTSLPLAPQPPPRPSNGSLAAA
jgi:phosphoribosyl 1,2-cyclic phosphodiesterase